MRCNAVLRGAAESNEILTQLSERRAKKIIEIKERNEEAARKKNGSKEKKRTNCKKKKGIRNVDADDSK